MGNLEQIFSVKYNYKVYFTENIFNTENLIVRESISKGSKEPKKVLFVLDSGVVEVNNKLVNNLYEYTDCHKDAITRAGDVLVIPGGEQCKNNFEYVHTILEAIHERGICRHSYVVAIGGGALLDLAGFAATIAHRGIKHIRIPTTVLSQNDSGIGVKNGVNAFGKKNFLGCFSPPDAVINDFQFLKTLDERDWRSGIAEAIKVALIKDKVFYDFLKKNATLLNCRDEESMKKLIHRCADLHMQHIASGDPFESGSSRPLDFGHWSAHKLEKLTEFEIRHGEAVAIGIALDTVYSRLIGYLTQEESDEILEVIKDCGFRLYVPELSLKDKSGELLVLKGLEEFREHLGGKLTVTLLKGIGKGCEVHSIDHKLMKEAVLFLERQDRPKIPLSIKL
ncbi:MAG TPA: 3-dehydroquinate synthase [Cytophagaceae bacterium]